MFSTLTEGLQSVKKQVIDQVSPESKLYVPVGGKRTTSPDEPPFDLLEAVQQFLVFEQPTSATAELVERRIEAKGSAKTKEGRVKEGIVKENEAKEAREITAVEGIKKTHKTKEIQEGKETQEAKESSAFKGDYRKVLLLRGDVGSGKSCFCHHLEAKLWKDYHEGQPIPLFIPLPLLKDPIHHAIKETLTLYGFSPEQITALKKDRQFIFILDGYDELHQFKNLYMSNKLYEWQAKVIITCRSQALYHVEDVDKYFMPFEGEKRQPWLLREYYVAPFSEEQIEAYIQLYEASSGLKTEPTTLKEVTITFKDKEGAKKEKDQKSDKSEEKEMVQEKVKEEAKEKESRKRELSPTYQKLQSIPGLEKLIKTPFLLHLALEALPDVLAKHQEKDGKDWRCTQAILYDLFVARWFKRQEDKLKASRHLDEKAEDIKPKFWQYCKELALKMREQDVTYIAYERTQRSSDLFSGSTSETTIENPWDKFFKADKSLDLIRSACPLQEYGKGVYGFFHASMIEYFATRAMYEELIATPQSTVSLSSEQAASVRVKKVPASASTVPEKETKSAEAARSHQQTSSASTAAKETKATGSTQSHHQTSSTHAEKRKAVVSIATSTTSTRRDSLFAEYEEYEERKEDRLFSEEDPETSVSSKEATRPKPQGHLHAKSFTRDLVAVSFLADRLALDEEARDHFKATLFQTLEKSKEEESYAIGAANAITILNFARIQFSGMDFRSIRVPDADVSYGIFDNTQFQGETTDLTNVTFTGAWLRQANFTGATMSGVKFGEWPYIKFEKAVNACVFSPDGQWFAVGCGDHNIYLYETATRKWIRTFEGHTGDVRSVAFDAKGERLASGSWDNTVRLWEVASGRLLRTRYTNSVNSVAFDAKGERLASGDQDYTVCLWEVATGRLLRTLKGHTGQINSVAFDAKGERLASGSYDMTIRLWELASGQLLRTLEGHTASVRSVAFDAKGERLASGSEDKTVRLWEMVSGRLLRTFEGHTGDVNSVAFDAKSERLASGSKDKTVRLWEVASGQLLRILEGHTKSVDSVAFDVKGERLASGSGDMTLRLWEVASGQLQRTLDGHTNSVTSVVFDAKGERLASGSEDKTICLWDVVSGRLLRTLEGHMSYVHSVAFDAEGERLASGSIDKTVRLWEVVSGQLLRTLEGHTDHVNSVAFDAQGKRLASGSVDKTVRLWEVASGQLLRTLEGHTFWVTSVAFDAKSERLASGSWDKTVRLWEVVSGRLLRTLEGHTGCVMSIAFDAKGERLASGSFDNTVRLWDVASGQLLQTLEGHTSGVNSVAFDAKAERLASGSWDNTVRLWDVQSGRCLYALEGFIGEVRSVAWRENQRGSFLVTGSSDKAVRCWQVIEKGKGKLQVILRWTSHQAALTLTEACIENVKGLDATNLELLQQRGALSKAASPKEEKQFHSPAQHEISIKSSVIEEKATPSKNTKSKNYSPGFFDSKQEPLSLESPASGKPAPQTPSRCCVIL